MKNTLSLAILLLMTFVFKTGWNQVITVPNPSFERTNVGSGSVQQATYNHWQWYRCNPQGTADMMAGDGLWGVNKPAQHLDYYGFMLATWPQTHQWESIGADLSSPFNPCQTYEFTVQLANLKRSPSVCPENGNSYSNLYWEIELELYGTDTCGFDELLWESGHITHCDWQQYTVTFTPSAAYTQIHWRPKMVDLVALGLPVGWQRQYAVGVDNMSDIVPLNYIPLTDTVNVQLCAGDSVFASGAYQTLPGIYHDSLQTISGCDSVIVTVVSVAPAYTNNTTINICTGDSVLIGGVYQQIAGIYSDTIQSLSSCDSIISTTLNVLPAYFYSYTLDICNGDSILVGGAYQTASGVYSDTIQTLSSCDSIISTTLNVLPVYFYSDTIDICNGDSVLIGGAYQTVSGVYSDTIQTLSSCDSIISTTLNVLPAYFYSYTLDICNGDSILVGGAYQTASGVYSDTIQTLSSCDSIISTTLNVLPVYFYSDTIDICNGDSVLIGGAYQTVSGVYSDTIQTLSSCDSIISTTLNVLPAYFYSNTINICNGDSALIGGIYQNTAGWYVDTLISSGGCESIVETNLIVLGNAYTYNDTICQGDSLYLAGNWQYQSGIYSDTLLSFLGCDSIINVELFVLPGEIINIDSVPDLCEFDNPIYLSSSIAGGVWSGNGLVDSNTGEFSPSIAGPGLHTLNYYIAGSCPVSQSIDVEVISSIELTIDSVDILCHDDEDFYLSASINGGIWNGIGVDANSGLLTINEAGVGIHEIVYISNGTCSAQDTIEIIITDTCNTANEGLCFVPNAFTPNGDQFNQTFMPIIDHGVSEGSYELLIFNRWGELIFTSRDTNIGWDGTYNGETVKDDVYIWTLKFKHLYSDKRTELTGHVTLFR